MCGQYGLMTLYCIHDFHSQKPWFYSQGKYNIYYPIAGEDTDEEVADYLSYEVDAKQKPGFTHGKKIVQQMEVYVAKKNQDKPYQPKKSIKQAQTLKSAEAFEVQPFNAKGQTVSKPKKITVPTQQAVCTFVINTPSTTSFHFDGMATYVDSRHKVHKYVSMPTLQLDACSNLALMWTIQGIHEFVEATYSYNLLDSQRSHLPAVLKALQSHMRSPAMVSHVQDGCMKYNDYALLFKDPIMSHFPQFSQPQSGKATPFMIIPVAKGYHIWVHSAQVHEYVKAYTERQLHHDLLLTSNQQIDQESWLDDLPSDAEVTRVDNISQQPGFKPLDVKAQRDRDRSVLNASQLSQAVSQRPVERTQQSTETQTDGVTDEIGKLAKPAVVHEEAQTDEDGLLVPDNMTTVNTVQMLKFVQPQEFWPQLSKIKARLVINGVQRPCNSYSTFCIGVDIRLSDQVGQALITYGHTSIPIAYTVDYDWQDMYPDAILTVRIGFNVLLVYTGTTDTRPLPNKLNQRMLYSVDLCCNITSDKLAVDKMRSDHNLTVYTNTQSYTIRINKAIQVHGRASVNGQTIVLNDTNNELRDVFTRAVYYLNVELKTHRGFDDQHYTAYSSFLWLFNCQRHHSTVYQRTRTWGETYNNLSLASTIAYDFVKKYKKPILLVTGALASYPLRRQLPKMWTYAVPAVATLSKTIQMISGTRWWNPYISVGADEPTPQQPKWYDYVILFFLGCWLGHMAFDTCTKTWDLISSLLATSTGRILTAQVGRVVSNAPAQICFISGQVSNAIKPAFGTLNVQTQRILASSINELARCSDTSRYALLLTAAHTSGTQLVQQSNAVVQQSIAGASVYGQLTLNHMMTSFNSHIQPAILRMGSQGRGIMHTAVTTVTEHARPALVNVIPYMVASIQQTALSTYKWLPVAVWDRVRDIVMWLCTVGFKYATQCGAYAITATTGTMTSISKMKWHLVGADAVAVRTHTSKRKFAQITDYNSDIMTRFKFVTPTKIIKASKKAPGITRADAQLMYDTIEEYCNCSKAGPRIRFTDIPDMDDNQLTQCFTGCPVNCLSSLYQRQAAAHLTAEPQYQAAYEAWCYQDPDINSLIASINASQDRPNVGTYLDKIRREQPSKHKLYMRKTVKLGKSVDLNYQCSIKAKDGEYGLRDRDDLTEKEPRSIYSAPEATVIYGGAVTQVVTRHMLLNDNYGICRTNEWVTDRVRQMWQQYKDPMFVTMDGKRFDSTQHWWMRECVDNKIYMATQLYDKMDIPRSHQVQAYEINCGRKAHYQLFVGSGKRRHCIFTCVIEGTMSSGKNDTSTMNTVRQGVNVNFTTWYIQNYVDATFRCQKLVAGDDLLLCMERHHQQSWAQGVGTLYSQVLTGQHGIGQCVVDITYHQPNQFSFLSKLGYIDAFNCYYIRQPGRILDLQVQTDAFDVDAYTLANCLAHSLRDALPNSAIVNAMTQLLPNDTKKTDMVLHKHLNPYRLYQLLIEGQFQPMPDVLYQDLIKAIGDKVNDPQYYSERYQSLAGFKRLTNKNYIPAPNKLHYVRQGVVAQCLNYYRALNTWLIPQYSVHSINKAINNSEKQNAHDASSLVMDTAVVTALQPRQLICLQVGSVVDGTNPDRNGPEFKLVGAMSMQEHVRQLKLDALAQNPKSTHAQMTGYILNHLPPQFRKQFQPMKVKLPGASRKKPGKSSSQLPKKLAQRQTQVKGVKPIFLKPGQYIKVGSEMTTLDVSHQLDHSCTNTLTCTCYEYLQAFMQQYTKDFDLQGQTMSGKYWVPNLQAHSKTVVGDTANQGSAATNGDAGEQQYKVIGMEKRKKEYSQMKQNRTGYAKPLHNPFVASILKPFKTEPIKPYFDYPLNTALLEQTLEFTTTAILGDGTGVLPVGTYGTVVSINPHAYQDLQITNSLGAVISSIAGQPLGSTRFINVFKQGQGAGTDVVANYASPLNTYYGANNSLTARWSSARTVRLGLRVIPTSPQLSRAGYINIVQIPGKDLATNVQFGSLGTTAIVVPIPSQTQIRNYPTSYEATNASNQTEHDYVWFPTDLLDSIFCQDNLSVAYTGSGTGFAMGGDMETFTNHLRNTIYFVATGLSSTDTFRFEVKVTYEFVPTTTYRIWANDEGPRAGNGDQMMLKEIAINLPAIQADQEEDSIYDKIGGFAIKLAKSALSSNIVSDIAMTGLRSLMSTKF